jgi:long-chain fatty acid transport protein
VDYVGTEGFEKTGWSPTASIQGFGWESMSVVSTGLQLKAIKKVPLRFGYTYSTNPIKDELAFFSTPATAIIAHAFQFGFSILFSDAFSLDAVYHYGMSDGKTEGEMFNPMLAPSNPPYGAIPGSTVAYDMNTHMFMLGLNFAFGGSCRIRSF